MMMDVNVHLLDFPNGKTKEMVVCNDDDSYTVFINARLSHESQVQAYQHAMQHILSNDFQKSDIQKIETDAHNDTDLSN